jgi:hypothetical protein
MVAVNMMPVRVFGEVSKKRSLCLSGCFAQHSDWTPREILQVEFLFGLVKVPVTRENASKLRRSPDDVRYIQISLVVGLVILSLVIDLGLVRGTKRLGFK